MMFVTGSDSTTIIFIEEIFFLQAANFHQFVHKETQKFNFSMWCVKSGINSLLPPVSVQLIAHSTWLFLCRFETQMECSMWSQ